MDVAQSARRDLKGAYFLSLLEAFLDPELLSAPNSQKPLTELCLSEYQWLRKDWRFHRSEFDAS